MKNQEILTKAIQKAIDGGWEHRNGWTYLANYTKHAPFNSVQFIDEVCGIWHMPIETLIFNHDFAKALWPGQPTLDRIHGNSGLFDPIPYWIMHLQQMVIAEDPIKYLGDNL